MRPTEEERTVLHREAREYADLCKWKGAEFDKKHLRWNDIVEVGIFYADCGVSWSMDVALAGVREAVDACIKEISRRPRPNVLAKKPWWLVRQQSWVRIRPYFDFVGPMQPDPQYIEKQGPPTMIYPWMKKS